MKQYETNKTAIEDRIKDIIFHIIQTRSGGSVHRKNFWSDHNLI